MNFAKSIRNSTYATVRAEPMVDRHGADVLCVVAKLALAFEHRGNLGLSVRPVRTHDEPDGHGGIRFPADFAAEKIGTDVGLVGTLIPPEKAEINQLDVWLRLGSVGKAAKVFGSRVFMKSWQNIGPGPSMPLEKMPLVHAFAYGGTDGEAEQTTFEWLNPSGRGFAVDREKLVHRPAPQIEPAELADVRTALDLKSLPARSQAAFAPIPARWEPRSSRQGTRDMEWRRTRAPVVPVDYDPRYESWAAAGLHSETPLQGNEGVELAGFRPGKPFRFRLPGFAPKFRSAERSIEREHSTHLDGVLFDMDAGVVELTWRAVIPLPLKWAKLERIDVSTARALPSEIVNNARMQGYWE